MTFNINGPFSCPIHRPTPPTACARTYPSHPPWHNYITPVHYPQTTKQTRSHRRFYKSGTLSSVSSLRSMSREVRNPGGIKLRTNSCSVSVSGWPRCRNSYYVNVWRFRLVVIRSLARSQRLNLPIFFLLCRSYKPPSLASFGSILRCVSPHGAIVPFL